MSEPSIAHRIAMIAIVLGAFGVVLATVPYKSFELDRHFIPKELALHAAATFAAVFALAGVTRVRVARVDMLLIAYLGLSALSILVAPNWWNGVRAFAISASSAALFWAAGVVGRDRLLNPLLIGLTLAMLVGICTALAQAYGVVGDYASLSRAPGGTFGNRNFMAHLAVICAPMLVYLTLRAKRAGFAAGAIALILVSGALVLSRSRAAWVALILGSVVALPLMWRLRPFAAPGAIKRIVPIGIAIIAGVAAALFVPNTLEWKSDSPYLDSMRGVVNYKEGSGKGRLVQYKRTLNMTMHSPLLGVGAGNWAVEYPKFAPMSDPSIGGDGRASNPWPSSDWMAILSERGVLAFLCFVFAIVGLLAGAWQRWRRADADARTDTSRGLDERALAIVLAVTVIVTATVGAFDAVLSIAIPSLFAWTIFGALAPRRRTREDQPLAPTHRRWLMITAAILGVAFTTRSVMQVYAMGLFERGSLTTLQHAARIDPGNYRIQMRLASIFERRGRCKGVRTHAGAAHTLYPEAPQPAQMLRACGVSME